MTEYEIDAKKLLAALRHLVSRAWQTFAQTPDPDRRFRTSGAAWPFIVVHDFHEAYGYSAPRARRFAPTAQDISNADLVMTWMAWLKREEGDDAIRRIMAWSLGVPAWMLGQRERCSEKTVLNRIDRSLNRVLMKFLAADADVDPVEELERESGSILGWSEDREPMHLPEGTSAIAVSGIEPGKVFIDGIGYMFRGRPWDNGERKTKKYA